MRRVPRSRRPGRSGRRQPHRRWRKVKDAFKNNARIRIASPTRTGSGSWPIHRPVGATAPGQSFGAPDRFTERLDSQRIIDVYRQLKITDEQRECSARAEPMAGIVLGTVVFGGSTRVSLGLILLEASGLIAVLIGVILAARPPALSRGHRSRRRWV